MWPVREGFPFQGRGRRGYVHRVHAAGGEGSASASPPGTEGVGGLGASGAQLQVGTAEMGQLGSRGPGHSRGATLRPGWEVVAYIPEQKWDKEPAPGPNSTCHLPHNKPGRMGNCPLTGPGHSPAHSRLWGASHAPTHIRISGWLRVPQQTPPCCGDTSPPNQDSSLS